MVNYSNPGSINTIKIKLSMPTKDVLISGKEKTVMIDSGSLVDIL